MSRTWKTLSTSAFERKHGVEYWWDHPEAADRYSSYGLPTGGKYAPPPKRGESKAKLSHRRKYWGGVRCKTRMALLRGEEPEPTRTRRSVLWNLS